MNPDIHGSARARSTATMATAGRLWNLRCDDHAHLLTAGTQDNSQQFVGPGRFLRPGKNLKKTARRESLESDGSRQRRQKKRE